MIRGSDSQELELEDVTVFVAGINEIQLDAAGTMIYWEDDSQNIMRAPVDGSYIERVVAGRETVSGRGRIWHSAHPRVRSTGQPKSA